MREQAAAWAAALGVPTRKHEDWKYTPIKQVLDSQVWTPGQLTSLSEAELAAILEQDADQIRVVFINGHFAPELSDLRNEKGLSLTRISEDVPAELGTLASLNSETFSVIAHLGHLEKPAVGYFAAKNVAEFAEGLAIRVVGGAQIESPIHFVHVATGQGASSHPRILVVAEPEARFTLLESYVSQGEDAHFTNSVVEITVGSGANIEHIKLQQQNLASVHVGLTEVRQAADSTYRNFSVTFGGKLTRNDLNIFVDGEHAHCRMDGVVCIDGDQLADNHTRLDHAKPNCDTFEVYKHLLDGNAEAVFNGKIFVHQDAQKTDAKQTNQTLLLSPTATMNTKPQLEIFADDVKCTHGATIGQLREDAMFYLRSRGISEAESRALLVYAFAAEVLTEIQHESTRDRLERMLFTKLGM